MSRRITFVALATSATLIATQAAADRECFEDSCRVPEAAEPPAPAVTKSETSPAEPQAAQAQAQAEPLPSASQASAIPEQVPPEITVTEIPAPAKPVGPPAAQAPQAAEARAESKPAPVSALPKVVAEPAPLKPAAEPAPRYTPPQVSTRAEDARIRREPVRVAPDYAPARKPPLAPAGGVAAAPQPARTVNVAVPAYVRPERPPGYVPPAPPAPPADYVVQPARPSTASAAVVEVPGEIQTGDGLVTVYPNLRPDPAWKLCQIDSRDLGRRSYRCTAYSYHPYGEGGYRPYGVYRNHPPAPGYVVAPNAKIIAIDGND